MAAAAEIVAAGRRGQTRRYDTGFGGAFAGCSRCKELRQVRNGKKPPAKVAFRHARSASALDRLIIMGDDRYWSVAVPVLHATKKADADALWPVAARHRLSPGRRQAFDGRPRCFANIAHDGQPVHRAVVRRCRWRRPCGVRRRATPNSPPGSESPVERRSIVPHQRARTASLQTTDIR